MQSSANQTDRHPARACTPIVIRKKARNVWRGHSLRLRSGQALSAAFDLTVPGTQRLSRQSTVQQAILSTIDLTQIALTQGKNRVWRRHSCPATDLSADLPHCAISFILTFTHHV